MKVYVDFEDLDEKTFTNNALIYINRKKDIDYVEQIKIQSLTNYTKQVRKEVVQEIKKFLDRQDEIVKTIYYNSYQTSGLKVIEETIELLDQIQGETK